MNHGICYARHFVERYVKTKYLMFLDSDDVLYPNAVRNLYKKIESDRDLMAVGCYLEYIDLIGNRMGGGLYLGETTKKGFYEKAAKEKLIFMQPTAIYDRELALSVGGYVVEGFPQGKPRYQDYCEDLDLWTRMSDLYIKGKAIIVIPEVLCKYRKGSGLSANSFNMVLKMKYTKSNLKRRRRGEKDLSFTDFMKSMTHEDYMKLKKESLSADALRNAYLYMKQGRVLSFLSSLMISIVNNPYYLINKIKHNLIKRK